MMATKRQRESMLKTGDLYQNKDNGKLFMVTVPGKSPEWGVRCITGRNSRKYPRTASIKLLSRDYEYKGNVFAAVSDLQNAIDDSKHK